MSDALVFQNVQANDLKLEVAVFLTEEIARSNPPMKIGDVKTEGSTSKMLLRDLFIDTESEAYLKNKPKFDKLAAQLKNDTDIIAAINQGKQVLLVPVNTSADISLSLPQSPRHPFVAKEKGAQIFANTNGEILIANAGVQPPGSYTDIFKLIFDSSEDSKKSFVSVHDAKIFGKVVGELVRVFIDAHSPLSPVSIETIKDYIIGSLEQEQTTTITPLSFRALKI